MTNPGEVVLWEGDSPPPVPWYRRRPGRIRFGVGVVLFVVALGLVLWFKDGDDLLFPACWVVGGAVSYFLRPLLSRNLLSHGHYTLTDHRLLIEARISGFRVRREENLGELRYPTLREDGTIAFGDPKSGSQAGSRPDGSLIQPIVLSGVAEPERVLELIRETQRKLR